jgi:hypothetical protein
MVKLTKAQRESVKRLWRRLDESGRPPFREFRRTVAPMFGGDGAVFLPYCGMWIGIEPDGYAHS